MSAIPIEKNPDREVPTPRLLARHEEFSIGQQSMR